MTIFFELPGLPKPFNQLARGRTWLNNKKERERLFEEIGWLTLGKRPDTPFTVAKLRLERHSSKCPDFDGLVSSFKFVVDALVALKIIADDNMKVIGVPDFRWVKAPKGKGKIKVWITCGI